MPREDNPDILSALRRAFADEAPTPVAFSWTSETGGFRADEGLEGLLPRDLALDEKKSALRDAIVAALDAGVRPNRTTETGDAQMQLAAGVFHEFRIPVAGVRLFIKVNMQLEVIGNPKVKVISVKKADS